MARFNQYTGSDDYRFWQQVKKPDEGCWEWQSALSNAGYGRVRWKGRRMAAHRAAYIIANGAIPEGHQVHHACGNRACVRPSHLEAVVPHLHVVELSPNALAYANARKTHCLNGHPITDPDSFYVKLNSGRQCKQCTRDRSARRKSLGEAPTCSYRRVK